MAGVINKHTAENDRLNLPSGAEDVEDNIHFTPFDCQDTDLFCNEETPIDGSLVRESRSSPYSALFDYAQSEGKQAELNAEFNYQSRNNNDIKEVIENAGLDWHFAKYLLGEQQTEEQAQGLEDLATA